LTDLVLRLAADENFNGLILRGLLRLNPSLDIVRIQDTDLSGAEDPFVLDWAAREGRVLITHDVKTITRFAFERVVAGKPMPGVFEVSDSLPIGQAMTDPLSTAAVNAAPFGSTSGHHAPGTLTGHGQVCWMFNSRSIRWSYRRLKPKSVRAVRPPQRYWGLPNAMARSSAISTAA
jgi:hypothetical protein